LHVSLPHPLIELLAREAAGRPGGSIDDLITEIVASHYVQEPHSDGAVDMADAFRRARWEIFKGRKVPGDSTEDIIRGRDELSRGR
jgi:hypothetical protein